MDNLNQQGFHHRSWFPFILIGLSLVLLAVIVVVKSNAGHSEQLKADAAAHASVPTNAEYEAAIHTILNTYNADKNATTAYNSLLAVTVPSVDYQAAHLDLVIAFAQLQAGKTVEGQARLDLALNTYSWLK